ncbi:MAG: serine/threonine-protein kinase [Lapillicoccus sp.]
MTAGADAQSTGRQAVERPQQHERLGPYRLVHQLGEGGMGVVHLALDRHGRAVAIKVLRAHVAYDPDARARLEREVDTLARIRDDRVAAVIDADIFGDRPYLVTRYVAGPSLDEVVADSGPLVGDELLRLGRGLVGALDAIHAVGVIHRDLKPGNVLLEDGEPVVIDFGIAHVADDIRLTSVGLVMGTPGYLSPEVVEGSPVTEATDWWGWAATLAFAASGRPPFGRGPMDVVLDRVRRGHTDLTGIDARLTPLLQAALSPDPRRRPPAGEVVHALERYASGGPATVVVPRGSSQPDPLHSDGGYPEPLGWDVPLPEEPARWRAPMVRNPAVRSTSALPQVEPWVVEGAWAGGPAAAGPAAAFPAEVDDEDESDWQAAWDADPGQPDPRIGRPMRTGTLAALLAATAAAAATWPGFVVAGVVIWCWAARFSDRSVTSLVIRRFDRGHRRSDVPMAVVLSPWHLLTSAVSTVAGLVLPGVVAVSAAFCTTLGITSLASVNAGQATPASLSVGLLAGALVAWWGPGGASLRRGSRSVVRGVVRAEIATQVVVGLLVALALGLAVLALVRGGQVVWWPLPGDPGAALRAPVGS